MAHCEHLPIFKKAMGLALFVGTDLRNIAREAVRLIIVANSRERKLEALTQPRDTVEEPKVVITLCKEINVFKSFVALQSADFVRNPRKVLPQGGMDFPAGE